MILVTAIHELFLFGGGAWSVLSRQVAKLSCFISGLVSAMAVRRRPGKSANDVYGRRSVAVVEGAVVLSFFLCNF